MFNNIPVGLDPCFYIGLDGFCGQECYFYKQGECKDPNEIKETLKTEEQLKLHTEIYGEDE